MDHGWEDPVIVVVAAAGRPRPSNKSLRGLPMIQSYEGISV